MRVSDLRKFLADLPPAVKNANPEVTLWVPEANKEYALNDADFDVHGKPPLWVTLNAKKVEYEREGWWEKRKPTTNTKGKKAS